MSRQLKDNPEAARLTQVNVRLPEVTRQQIADLRAALGLSSNAQVVVMAVDRMAQSEMPKLPATGWLRNHHLEEKTNEHRPRNHRDPAAR